MVWLAVKRRVCVLVLGLVASAYSHSNSVEPKREYVQAEQAKHYAALLEEFGTNKIFAKGYELQALTALSYFPRLKNINIEFIVRDEPVPMAARPTLLSLFKSAKHRVYQVISDTQMDENRSALLLKNQPFNAQVGILGHELAHIDHYLDRSFWGLLADALCQFSNCRQDFEQENDLRLVAMGLGWQRYDHAVFVSENIKPEFVSPNTAEGSIYLTPESLLMAIKADAQYAKNIKNSIKNISN